MTLVNSWTSVPNCYYRLDHIPSGNLEVAVHDEMGNRITIDSKTVGKGKTFELNFVGSNLY